MPRRLTKAALYASLASLALCRPDYPARIPNGMAGSNPSSGLTCTHLGHNDCIAGAPRNQFGLDFQAAGLRWTKELCQMDSDGDGVTNGEELGDPCCEWAQGGAPPARSDMLSHPGVAEESGASAAPKCNAANGAADPAATAAAPPATTTTAAATVAEASAPERRDVPGARRDPTKAPPATTATKSVENGAVDDAAEEETDADEVEEMGAEGPGEVLEDDEPSEVVTTAAPRKMPKKCNGEEKAVLVYVNAGMRRRRRAFRIRPEARLCRRGYGGSSICLKVPYKTKTVEFKVDGKVEKIEKYKPYCIAGDTSERGIKPWARLNHRSYGKTVISYKTDKESVDVPVYIACGSRGRGRSGPSRRGQLPARGDTPADTPADAPADAPADTPADAPADTPADAPADTPAESSGGERRSYY